MVSQASDHSDRIRATAEAEFRRPVFDIAASDWTARATYRVRFEDRTVIAVRRPSAGRTRLEAMVLRMLAPGCDVVPRYLGLRDDTLFHTDPGHQRLSAAVAKADSLAAEDLADQAVGAIFAYQIAGRDLAKRLPLPPLGSSVDWMNAMVAAVDVLSRAGGPLPRSFDRNDLAGFLAAKPASFVKWDARSDNAALNSDGNLCWSDFGRCGLRHGAEDFAWLVADEVWPVAPATMLEVLRDNYRDHFDAGFDDWLGYLSAYVVFHALQRLKTIVTAEKSQGWSTRAQIRDRGGVGLHPDFAARLCEVGAFFADRDRRTAGLVPAFQAAQADFSRRPRDTKVA